MKRCSFKVAQAIKEAGYPQELDVEHLVINKKGYIGTYDEFDYNENLYSCPTYLEVWLWLWREKKINVTPEYDQISGLFSSCGFSEREDPEEAIEAAIEFLVNNSNLIR